MAEKNLDPKALAESLELLLKSKGTTKELVAQIKLYNVALDKSVQEAMRLEHTLNSQEGISKNLVKYASDLSKSEEKRLAASKLAENIDIGRSELAEKRGQAEADMLLKQTMYNTGLTSAYAEQAKSLILAQKLGTITKTELDYQLQQLKAEQDYVEHLNTEVELMEEINAKTLEIREESEGWKQSLTKAFETAKAIGRDPKVFGLYALSQVIEKGEKVLQTFESLDKSGMSIGQRVQYMSKGFSMMSALGLSDTKGVLDGMVESYGTLNAMSDAQVDHVGHLAKEMGVAGEEAFALVDGFSKMPGETMETAAAAADYTNNLAKANGLAPGKLTRDMAKNTEAMALFSGKGAQGFAKAAVELHKMGVDIATASKLSEGLLNFEDSINKQMEASVLLGREINLDKARELSLNGDLEGATKEVLKNIGGQAEFEQMNVVQKKALADATGLTVEQLAKAVDAQAEFNKYHGEDASLWDKSLGAAMEYGSAVGGFLKENGQLMISSIQFMQNLGLGKLKDWAIDKAKFAWEKTAALARAGWAMLSGKGKEAGGAVDKAKDLGGDKLKDLGGDKIAATADKTKGVKGDAGKGIKGFLKGLGDGLASIGKQFGNVVKGALALGLAGLALGAGFALALQMVKDVNPVTMIAFAGSIGIFGVALALMGKMGGNVIQGALALGIVAVALIPAAFAFSLLEGVSVEKIIAFSIALPLLGLAAAGLGFLAIPIALGAIALGALGVGMIAVAGGLMVLQAAEGGIAIFESLAVVAANASGLGGVAMAMIGIAGGLGLMAVAGLMAMPAIGALIALATVAPALTALGGALGGMFGGEGGGGEKEDKMDTLIAEIRELKAIASKGGVVNMDGKKVGEVVRLSLNSSGVR